VGPLAQTSTYATDYNKDCFSSHALALLVIVTPIFLSTGQWDAQEEKFAALL